MTRTPLNNEVNDIFQCCGPETASILIGATGVRTALFATPPTLLQPKTCHLLRCTKREPNTSDFSTITAVADPDTWNPYYFPGSGSKNGWIRIKKWLDPESGSVSNDTDPDPTKTIENIN